MARLLILGSGTPVPTPERWGTGFLLETAGEWVMIDCGPASTYKMHAMGVRCTEVGSLFLTHLHSDHVSDYPCFLMTRFDLSVGAEQDLHVFGPEPIRRITEGLWSRDDGLFWCDVVARTQHPMSVGAYHHRGGEGQRPAPAVHVREIGDGDGVNGKSWRCTAREVKHAQPYLDCLGYRFETEDGIVAFSGDSAPCEAVVELAREADVFVMEAVYREETIRNHTSREAQTGTLGAARMAREAGAKRLVIVHQSHTIAAPQVVSEAIHEIKTVFPGELYWGRDLMEISW